MWKMVDSSVSHEMPFTSGSVVAAAEARRAVAAAIGAAVVVGPEAELGAVVEEAACGGPPRLALSSSAAATTRTITNTPMSTAPVGKPCIFLTGSIFSTSPMLERSTPPNAGTKVGADGVPGAAGVGVGEATCCPAGCGGGDGGGWLTAPAIGRPHPRHAGARSDTSRPQSGHLMRATAPPYTRQQQARQLSWRELHAWPAHAWLLYVWVIGHP